jgi:mono/diheme cytochrome c family protein
MVDHDAVRAVFGALVVTTMVAAAARAPAAGDAAQARPDFAEHVSPILRAHCTSCHRPGRAAPFALLTYAEARAQGEAIVTAVESGHMPPAQAAIGDGLPALRDALHLNARQIAILRNWVATGMRPGDLRRVPPPPDYPMRWPLGLPDITITLPRALALPPSADARVFNVVLGLASAQDRWVRAVDFNPSSSGAITQVVFFTAPADHVIDDSDLLPGVPGLFSSDRLESPGDRLLAADRSLLPIGVWTPGGLTRVMPAGTGQKLPRWTNVVMQVHTRPSDSGAIEDGQVAIYLTPGPPPIELRPIQVPPSFGVAARLSIPAGEAAYVLRDWFTLPVDVDAYAARGHAYERGRSLQLSAILPGGAARTLLQIDRWDPRWQDTYFFAAPIRLPKGTRVQTEIVYDNSPSNARIAGLQSRRVSWGPTLASEIGSMTLVVSVRSPEDGEALDTARAAHFRAQILK